MIIPWWKIIGPETRTKIEWRKDLNFCSIYSVSCLTFSLIGFVTFFYNKTNIFEATLLILQGLTSFQRVKALLHYLHLIFYANDSETYILCTTHHQNLLINN